MKSQIEKHNIPFVQVPIHNDEHCIEHIENVGDIIEKALQISELIQFEIHGQKEDLDQLKEPLKDLDITYFEYLCGFRK